MKCPLPLAAIAIRRDLVAAHGADDRSRAARERRVCVRASRRQPRVRREHAQEMDAAVAAKHIQLYVNDYTVALDERAVHALLDFAQQQEQHDSAARRAPIFI